MNVNSPEFLEDPYHFYKIRREQSPVFKANEYIWSITAFDVMAKVLADPAAGRGNIGQKPQPGVQAIDTDVLKQNNPALQILDNWMLFKNPPAHTRLRKLVQKAFTTKMIDQLEPLMRTTMRKLIGNIKANNPVGHFDLVSTIAYPFPVTVICEMIGIPVVDRDRFRAWSQDFTVAVQSDFQHLDSTSRTRLNQSAIKLGKYFEELIPVKKRGREDDLMSGLIDAGAGEKGLTEQEIVANCVFLLFSGHETTTSLITNGINALLQHPAQYERLVSDPSLVVNTVEECLRYDPPIQMVGRYVIDDFTVDNCHFNRGDHIYAFLGAAGRDPLANPWPDKFDINRNHIRHLAFARGAHHCLGSALARLEAKVAFEEILAGIPDLRLAGTGKRRKTWLMRGFDSLVLHYGGGQHINSRH